MGKGWVVLASKEHDIPYKLPIPKPDTEFLKNKKKKTNKKKFFIRSQ